MPPPAKLKPGKPGFSLFSIYPDLSGFTCIVVLSYSRTSTRTRVACLLHFYIRYNAKKNRRGLL
jgi:hypothetical protein